MCHSLDVCRVDLTELAFLLFLQIQDVVVEPLSLDKQPFKLLFLFQVQPRRLDLAFERPDDLACSTRLCLKPRLSYRSPLLIGAGQPSVVLFHLDVFT